MTFYRRLYVRAAYLCLLFPGVTLAAQDMPRPADDLGAALVRTGAALLLILGLFFLLVYLLKRYLPGAFTPTKNSPDTQSHIELVATKQIGPKRFLHVVKVGKREFLVGSGEQGMISLGQWEADEPGSREPGSQTDSSVDPG